MTYTKNYSIEIWRFLMILLVCLFHHIPQVLPNAYFAVEFFFVISGFFLYHSATKPNRLSTLDYTLNKINRFLPEIIIVLPLCIYSLYEPWNQFLLNIGRYLTDAMCLGGMYFSAINVPIWYLTILIWAGAVLYSMLQHHRSFLFHIILPFSFVFGYSYLGFHGFKQNSYIPVLFIRGFIEMGTGIVLAKIIEKKETEIVRQMLCLNIISIIGLSGFMLCLLGVSMHLITIVGFLIMFLSGLFIKGTWLQKLFNNKFYEPLGKISFDILIIHQPIVFIFHHFTQKSTINPITRTVILLLIIIASAFLLKAITQKITQKILLHD